MQEQFQSALSGQQAFEPEFRITWPDGSIHHIQARSLVKHDEAGKAMRILGTSTDITDRKHAEARIRQSLQEKEVLLKETHHRVKNNLQIISSLLTMRMDLIADDNVRAVLMESQQRVRSMAMIHEQLYQSDSLARVDFNEYIQSIAHFLHRNYATNHIHVRLVIESPEEISLNIDTATPLGLILNERISNAFKHAFTDEKDGLLQIRLERNGKGYRLKVADNGPGLPEDFDLSDLETLGLQLVDTLAHQLKATLTINSEHGAAFQLAFEELVYAQRN